jgi:hypothetical protein
VRHLACDGTARDPWKRAARVATGWDAEALATAQAARVATGVGRMACRQGGTHGPWPGEFQRATTWKTAMSAVARVEGRDVVAGRGDLIRGGRGREGGGARGERVVREGDVCPRRAEGVGFGQRGGGRVDP